MEKMSDKPATDKAYLPIKRPEDIDRLRIILSEKPRDLLLFEMAIQTGMMMKDLLTLRVTHLSGVEVNERIPFPAGHRQGVGNPVMTREIHDAFRLYWEKTTPLEDDYLFKSRKGGNPISLTSASIMINKWFEAAGLKGLSGASSLRKTYEAHHKIFDQAEWSLSKRDAAPVLQPIKAETLQEQVYDQLLKAIISGRIPPGEQIVIEKVAENMHVSPMPVREALVRLEAEGVVMSNRKRRCIVKKLSPQDLADILEIRLMLESKAAETACLRSSPEFVDRLKELHRQYCSARTKNNIDLFLEINRKFHYTIYQHARKPILIQIINNLWDRASPYLHFMFQEMSRSEYDVDEITQDHQQIIHGMAEGDPEKVVTHLCRDLVVGSQLVQKIFSRIQ